LAAAAKGASLAGPLRRGCAPSVGLRRYLVTVCPVFLATSSATGRSSSSKTAQVVALAIIKALVVPIVWFLLAFFIIPH
jgi:hypothetical protein